MIHGTTIPGITVRGTMIPGSTAAGITDTGSTVPGIIRTIIIITAAITIITATTSAAGIIGMAPTASTVLSDVTGGLLSAETADVESRHLQWAVLPAILSPVPPVAATSGLSPGQTVV